MVKIDGINDFANYWSKRRHFLDQMVTVQMGTTGARRYWNKQC
jgi:hypothetical protein